jgi:NTP pyrophosphatase (non-canonical NTP hydrolase)
MTESTIIKFHKFVNDTYNYNFKEHNLLYLSNGLGGEVGEVQNEVKKWYRALNKGNLDEEYAREVLLRKDNIKKELGDVLWYLFAIANEIETNIEDIIETNIEKNTANIKNT